MRLVNAALAVVTREKITEYLLSLESDRGRGKAIFFMAHGFARESWERLAVALASHAAENDVVAEASNQFGARYVIEGPLHTPDGRTVGIRSVWFVSAGTDIPVLATAHPLKRRKRK